MVKAYTKCNGKQEYDYVTMVKAYTNVMRNMKRITSQW